MTNKRTPSEAVYGAEETNKFFLLLSIVFVLGSGFILNQFISGDAYWILHIAERLLDGQKAYVDFIEVNPPLIIWMTSIPVWLANIFEIDPEITFKLFLLGMTLISLYLIWIVLVKAQTYAKKTILFTATLVLVIFPNDLFGQREHIMLVLALPYIFTVYARSKNVKLSQTHLVFSSVLAALGICIKPYFVLIPGILELYLLYKLRTNTFKRIEPYILVFVGLSYLVSIFIFTPEYVNDIVPYLSQVYQAGTGATLIPLVVTSATLISLVLTIIYIIQKYHTHVDELYTVICLAAFANYLSYIVQLKGWLNHLYPSNAMIFILAAGLAVELFTRKKTYVFAGFIALQCLLITYSSLSYDKLEPHNEKYFKNILKDYPEAKSVFVMSTWIQDGFPLINHSRFQWGSRFPSLWFATGIQGIKNSNGLNEELKIIDNNFKADLANDFKRYKTDLVFVDASEINLYLLDLDTKYDFITDYSQNEVFAKEWSNYRFVKKYRSYALYERFKNK